MSFYILLLIIIVTVFISIAFYYKALSIFAESNCNMEVYLEKISRRKREELSLGKENKKSK
jgi:hypothetical protein